MVIMFLFFVLGWLFLGWLGALLLKKDWRNEFNNLIGFPWDLYCLCVFIGPAGLLTAFLIFLSNPRNYR